MASSLSPSSSGGSNVFSRKQALRKSIRTKLKNLSREEIRSQSLAVWDRFKALSAYQNAQSVGLFLSMPQGEIDTDPIVAHAIDAGKTIYVPRVGQNFESADMALIRVVLGSGMTRPSSPAGGDEEVELFHRRWPRNKWGIPEPPPDMTWYEAQPGDIDVLVVPGLAFDRAGSRLGQGKGYYDRFIDRMEQATSSNEKPPVLVAVGLNCQLVEEGEIPVKDHDFPVDWVLLPHATIQVIHKESE